MNVGKKLGLLAAVVLSAVAAAVGVTASPAAAHGCTPGFFKNHTQFFTPTYQTNTTLGTAFGSNVPAALSGVTLQNALYFPGGPDLLGAQQIFLRAATAALLNANNTDIGTPGADFGMSTSYVLWYVNMMFVESNYRSAIIGAGALLDGYNNYGGCAIG